MTGQTESVQIIVLGFFLMLSLSNTKSKNNRTILRHSTVSCIDNTVITKVFVCVQ